MSIIKSAVNLEILDYQEKGRGVCLKESVTQGTVIESLPVLVLEAPIYARVKKLPFINHTFVWDRGNQGESGAIGFGFASLCNHSSEPNAVIHKNQSNSSIDLVALRDIAANEEVTIKYNNTLFRVF